jgi:uncharacterized delta-60 repeat protein
MRSRAFAHAVVASGCVLAMVSGGVQTASAAPGDLDPSFGGGDGQVTKKFATGGAFVETLALQKDGKILAGGSVQLSSDNWAWILVRYAAAGTLDQSFGNHGRVSVDFTTRRDEAWDIALSPGGRIVLAGQSGPSVDSRFALVRLNGNGTRDHTFGGDGKITESLGGPSYAWDVVVQADGSIVVTGNANGGSFDAVAVAAFHENGTPDTGFGDAGSWIANAPDNAYANAILHLPSGKYMVGASVQVGVNEYDVGLFRFGANGQPDSSFGTDGLVTRDFGASELVTDMRRTGSKFVMSIGRFRNGHPPQMAAVRLLAGGAADTGFGNLGLAPAGLPNAGGEGLAVQQDGKIVVAGDASPGATDRFAVARFLAS